MPIQIQPSRFPSAEVPSVDNRGIVAAQTFNRGAPIQLSSGNAQEHPGGATVTGIYGFSLEDVDNGASSGANSTQVAIAIADHDTWFMGQLDNAGAVVAPDSGNLDTDYGLIKTGDDWFVDETDTTNVVVTVRDFDVDLNVVWFTVLPSAGANP